MKSWKQSLGTAAIVPIGLGMGLLFVLTISAAFANDTRVNLPTNFEVVAPEAYLPAVMKPVPTPTPTPGSGWLWYVNQFRAAAALPSLTEDIGWSSGGVLHSRYMVKEDDVSHDENSGSPWYTPEGDQAGQNGNIYVSSWQNTPDESAIDFWMAAPFHAVAIIDPELQVTGFGSYREDIGTFSMGATLDVQRGRGSLPPGISFPLTFPEDGGSTWLTQFSGFEWPDPLTSCQGYAAPTGPAIIVQLGSGGLTPNVTATGFSDGSTALSHCAFDETNYSNPDAGTQSIGRIILNNRDAVVILPRNPLTVGQSYTASVTANGNTISWQFTVVAPITTTSLQQLPLAHRQEAR